MGCSEKHTIVVLLMVLALAAPAASAPPAFTADWQASSGFLPDQVCPAWALSDLTTPEDPVLGASVLTLATDGDELMFYRQTEPVVSIPDPLVIE